jgi:hypothetical protein
MGLMACVTVVDSFSTRPRSHHKVPMMTAVDTFADIRNPHLSRNNINNETLSNHNHAQDSVVIETSRRQALQQMTLAITVLGVSPSAQAGVPELKSGNLYSPKSEMLRGGSQAARGIPVARGASARLVAGQTLQNVYETRFLAYLSRFLLNLDPSAHEWWTQQELNAQDKERMDQKFAEFAESVELGLANYFVGPYGSYSSLSAAKAGISAAAPAPSKHAETTTLKQGFLEKLFYWQSNNKNSAAKTKDGVDLAKQGVLNLYALLKARYTSVAAKKQLAILFSFISNPKLQPTREISALFGEIDNATVSSIHIYKPTVESEYESRTSSRRGGGYCANEFPNVAVDPPPALGGNYQRAQVRPIMKPTSRVLKITVVDRGYGYTKPPQVTIQDSGFRRLCQTAAILDRNGGVERILVLDPGYGYGGYRGGTTLKVSIEAPSTKFVKGIPKPRPARAVADLEYEIVGIEIESGGNGYIKTEPPKVTVSPPLDDPDWYLAIQEQPQMRIVPVIQTDFFTAEVAEMRAPDGNRVFSILHGVPTAPKVDDLLLDRLNRDPLELLPWILRPEKKFVDGGNDIYSIPYFEKIPQFVPNMAPRYRAFDPAFGGVGKLPVQIGAMELRTSEYARLALSGALCTVVVRTALNPLELVKTKQQLLNDDELFDYVRASKRQLNSSATSIEAGDETAKDTTVVGTIDLIKAMIRLRGPLALFQSADITFLASVMFGSFGFGATELFRRSFTQYFFTGGNTNNDGGGGSEIVLLLAAALATVVTAAAASPFELLRVRSMCLVEPTKWTLVLRDFLVSVMCGSPRLVKYESWQYDSLFLLLQGKDGALNTKDFDIRSLKPKEVLPLWAGFNPTLSRELPFAIAKFLTFDVIAKTLVGFVNAQTAQGALPVQVGSGPLGLAISAASGAVAGIAGAIVSHPADLILTKTSASGTKQKTRPPTIVDDGEDPALIADDPATTTEKPDWRVVVKELTSQEGGIANLFVGLGARSTFFFLVIGLQFFLYDYVKNLFNVGADDLDLVLDVFYAVRAGLVGMGD